MSYQDDNATWEAHLASEVHWKEAYGYVADRARTFLLAQPAGFSCNTTALACALYTGNDDFTRERVFQALKAQASHALHDCWKPGEAQTVKRFGRDVVQRPKVWAAPAPRLCPHCKGVLP